MEAESPPEPTTRPVRRELRSFAELFALCGFAIAYPLLDLYGRAPEHFVFRSAGSRQIIGFALVVTFVPPVALWLVEAVLGLVSQRARKGVHLALTGVLVAIFAVQALRPLASGPALLIAGGLAGAAAVAFYMRFEAARTWLLFASAAPLAFLFLYFATSDTSRLLRSGEFALADEKVGNPAPVVLVVFDELPAASLVTSDGEIDEELFPNFAALSHQSHWFRNATSVSTSTWHAAPAIATGRYPIDARAPFAAEHPDNLFALLGDRYTLNVNESITRLCPTELCDPPAGVPGGLRNILGDATDLMRARLSPEGVTEDPMAAFVEAPAPEPIAEGETALVDPFLDFELSQPARVRSLIDGVHQTDGSHPSLHYLHLLLPHVPYRYLPDGLQYPAPDVPREEDVWTDQEWPVTLARQRHVLQVAYVDALLGEIVTELQEQGIYDEALVIVTADHGISFQPGRPTRGVEDTTLDDEDVLTELMWVPLFVKLPGQTEGVVDDRNALTIDIVPTIADVVDVELPWQVDGRSLFGEPRPDDIKVFYNSTVTAFGVAPGESEQIDATGFLPRLYRLGIDRLLPPAGEPFRLWRAGPRNELVGTPASELGRDGRGPLGLQLDHPGDYEAVDPTSGMVPAVIQGVLEGVEPGDAVAVSVNGAIAATGYAYDRDGAVVFAVVVDGISFQPGPNAIEVFALEE